MLKNLPIVVLGLALIVIISVSCYTDPRHQGKQESAASGSQLASITQSEASYPGQKEQAPEHTPVWRLLLAWPEGVATLAVLLTLFFIAWQAILMRQTVSAAEDVAKRELRAYLTVVIGSGIYQEPRPVEDGGNLMFESGPLLVNTGRTPARKIKFKARSAVLPLPLSKDTHLPEEPDEGIGDSILGPQQSANMVATVDGFRPDNEVEGIKHGIGDKGLYVWGRVTYDDAFGDSHFTRFCQHIYWDLKGNVRGHYIPGRNDAD